MKTANLKTYQLLENVEQLSAKYTKELKSLQLVSNVTSAEEFKKTIDSYKKTDRLLKIGIIGRVKAGKSSLLNSLLFDGKSILPKAATPMTAALTIMAYSDDNKARATMEFYQQKDIDELKKEANEFEKDKQQLREKIIVELTNGRRKLSPSEIQQRADKRVDREMKNDVHFASYDQYQRIKNSGVKLTDLEQYQEISADSIEALTHNKLNDFVGAEGKYMPFTKAVTLYLPDESLKNLQIIDTPGVNDPIASRGERTEKLLQECDAVLVVSPSGQFLNHDDMELIGRVTTKNGIQETYIVASQADSQLFNDKQYATPQEAFNELSRTLKFTAEEILTAKGKEMPLMAGILNKFKQNDIICTSSVAFNLLKDFDQPAKWDELMEHVYKNFQRHYASTFADPSLAKEALQTLINLKPIYALIDDISQRKESILQDKVNDLSKGKCLEGTEFIEKVIQCVETRIEEIQNGDEQELKANQQNLSAAKQSLESNINPSFKASVVKVEKELKEQLTTKVTELFDGFNPNRAKKSKTETRTETYEVQVSSGSSLRKLGSWLSFGLIDDGDRYETRERQYTVTRSFVAPAQIKSQLNDINDHIEESLKNIAEKYLKEWKITSKRNFLAEIIKLRQSNVDLKKEQAAKASECIQYHLPTFKINKILPSHLDISSNQYDSAGDRYIQEAKKYIDSQEAHANQKVQEFLQQVMATLNKADPCGDILEYIQTGLARLMKDLQNKEQSIQNYTEMRNQFNQLLGLEK